MTRRVALLVNPAAGSGRAAAAGVEVLARLRAAGTEVVVLDASSAAESEAVAARALHGGVDALVVVGGDGTVHSALQAVGGTDTPLGIVPAGSGDDVARAAGVPLRDVGRAVEAILHGQARAMDLGRAADRWFGATLYAGFDAQVNARANRMRFPRGRSRYQLALLVELGVFHPQPFVLHLDGDVVRTEAMLVVVANGPSYGGGMLVCPEAWPHDGLLDVMVLDAVSRLELLKVFPRVYKGTHVTHPAVHFHRAASVTVAAPGLEARADGEPVAALPVTCEAVPDAVRILVPH